MARVDREAVAANRLIEITRQHGRANPSTGGTTMFPPDGSNLANGSRLSFDGTVTRLHPWQGAEPITLNGFNRDTPGKNAVLNADHYARSYVEATKETSRGWFKRLLPFLR